MKMKLLRILPAAVAILACAAAPSLAHPMAMPMMKPAASTPAPRPTAGVRVESAWVRAAPPGAMMLAGYMVLHNQGKTSQQFVSAESDVFGMVEPHKTQIINGVSTMRPAGELTIPIGGSLRFEPGGLHLMLMQPKGVLKVGDSVRFRLHFADGSVLDAVALVSAEAPAH
jgi:copper(I)-binding protein